jgi:hypothetical protein
MAIEKLENSKNGMDQQTFEETREFYRENYERVRGVR